MVRVRSVARALRDRPLVGDAALALVLAVVVVGDVLASQDYFTGPVWLYVIAGLLMTVPLALRRRAPLAVIVVVMGALIAQSLALGDSAPSPDSELVAWLVAVYSVAAHSERRAALAGGGMSFVAGLVWLGPDDFLLPVVVFGGAWFAGRLMRGRQLYAAALEERAGALERDRDVNARLAAAEERVRLARELHDVVGHSLSLMVVQAGAERLALGNERASTREALLAIERTGREALAEMSRLVGILRTHGEQLALAPRPSLAQVDALVQTVRDAGVPADLRVEGKPAMLPPGIDVSAYRILQEALTNVVKHAGPARASIVVRYSGHAVEVEVADTGRGGLIGQQAGYGLAGMRERVELCGGTLEAGNHDQGGFAIRARLPLGMAPP